MPLDNSLFRDFRCSFDFHVTMTCMLPRTEPRRFSKATPKLIGLVCDRNGHRRKSTEGDGRCYHARLEDQSAVSIDKIDLHKDCVEVTRELYFAEKDKFFNVSVEREGTLSE